MSVESKLRALVGTVLDEANRNPEFAERLASVFGDAPDQRAKSPIRSTRKPAALDPVALFEQGEQQLRGRLSQLDVPQLLDIVAEYGMDQARLVMKWKSAERISDHIVESARRRSSKGDAFREKPLIHKDSA